MKPLNNPYRGMWGSYKVGLPFYRVFCGTKTSTKKCQDASYRELLAWPSIRKNEDIKGDVYPWFSGDFGQTRGVKG